jgi:hypothetical protein
MKFAGRFFLVVSLLLFPELLSAHALQGMDQLPVTDVAVMYLKLGYTHILPLGADHVLFVLSMFFLNTQLKAVIWQATAFTLAHSVTFGLAMYGWISVPAYIAEPVIALSIMFVAVENIISDRLKASRITLVFIFGLVHGLGFADALSSLGLPENAFLTSLLTFNLGVELGQLSVILIAWFLVGKWFRERKWYRGRIVVPVSSLIAAVALYWTIERAFFA